MRKKKLLSVSVFLVAAAGTLLSQDIKFKIEKGNKPVIAVPDLRGSGDAQAQMDPFNQTLWNDLESSGVVTLVSRSLYPLKVPQRPDDFRPPPAITGRPSSMPSGGGIWLTDWSGPPVNANYLAFGYTGGQNGQLLLYGWFYDVRQSNLSSAEVFRKTYVGTLNGDGARKLAHEFAADILQKFGAVSSAGTKIYFISDRTGHKEIWSMDYDGSNQKRITAYNSITINPTVSPDGSKIAFTTFPEGRNPVITVFSTESGRKLPFYNQRASMNATPEFTPDGQHLIYSSTAVGIAQLYIANLDGSGLRRLTASRAIDIEPKVNPKTGAVLIFVSDRGGHPQIYRMNMDGTDVARLTEGEGDAVNPAWNPDGQHIAFSWTRGYEPGNFNVFTMDVASRKFDQLTHGVGRNEHPTWSPDGVHLAFSSNRSGKQQIWTMLANGTQLKELTTQGNNTAPAWGK